MLSGPFSLRIASRMIANEFLIGANRAHNCHELYCIRPIGDVNDSVFHYPYFPLFMGPFSLLSYAVGSSIDPVSCSIRKVIATL
jgi:hypothetical protein